MNQFKQKDFKHYRNLFQAENVKGLLKDLKVSLRDAKTKSMAPNPTLGNLEFKLAFIRKQQMKAELAAQKKAQKQLKRGLPPKPVQV